MNSLIEYSEVAPCAKIGENTAQIWTETLASLCWADWAQRELVDVNYTLFRRSIKAPYFRDHLAPWCRPAFQRLKSPFIAHHNHISTYWI